MNEQIDITTRELLSAYFDAIKLAHEGAEKRIVGVIRSQLEPSEHEIAVQGTFYRMHLAAGSLLQLNNVKDAMVSAGCARTLYELWLDMKYLCSDDISPSCIERYHQFPQVERFRFIRNTFEIEKREPKLKSGSRLSSEQRERYLSEANRQEDIKKIVTELWGKNKDGKPKWPTHWTGLSVFERAEKLGSSFAHEYRELFTLFSWYTHSGSTGIAGFSAEAFEALYLLAFDLGRQKYLDGLVLLANIFPLKDAYENFMQVVRKLKDAPKEILIEHFSAKIDLQTEKESEVE